MNSLKSYLKTTLIIFMSTIPALVISDPYQDQLHAFDKNPEFVVPAYDRSRFYELWVTLPSDQVNVEPSRRGFATVELIVPFALNELSEGGKYELPDIDKKVPPNQQIYYPPWNGYSNEENRETRVIATREPYEGFQRKYRGYDGYRKGYGGYHRRY